MCSMSHFCCEWTHFEVNIHIREYEDLHEYTSIKNTNGEIIYWTHNISLKCKVFQNIPNILNVLALSEVSLMLEENIFKELIFLWYCRIICFGKWKIRLSNNYKELYLYEDVESIWMQHNLEYKSLGKKRHVFYFFMLRQQNAS